MVLRKRRGLLNRTAVLTLAVVMPAAATAQSFGSTARAVLGSDPEYRLPEYRIGDIGMSASLDALLLYDGNVYATPEDRRDDAVLTLLPSVYFRMNKPGAGLQFGLLGQARVRRYLELSDENADAASVRADAAWSISPGQTLTANALWSRAIEDRGDPEARDRTDIGPRLFDIYAAEGSYRHDGRRFTFGAELSTRRTDAVSPLDDERDFDTYAARLNAGVRVGAGAYAIASGFVSGRKFQVARDLDGTSRDTTTYGAEAGMRFDPGGLVEGELSMGAFRLNPAEPTDEERTAFSARGSLTYRPRRRTALTLDVFAGDVPSFRAASSARVEQRVEFGIQQEIRHNLLASARAGYRRTEWLRTTFKEDTIVGSGEVEYLFSRHTSVAATVSYGTRSSDFNEDDFARFRTGAELRVRF